MMPTSSRTSDDQKQDVQPLNYRDSPAEVATIEGKNLLIFRLSTTWPLLDKRSTFHAALLPCHARGIDAETNERIFSLAAIRHMMLVATSNEPIRGLFQILFGIALLSMLTSNDLVLKYQLLCNS